MVAFAPNTKVGLGSVGDTLPRARRAAPDKPRVPAPAAPVDQTGIFGRILDGANAVVDTVSGTTTTMLLWFGFPAAKWVGEKMEGVNFTPVKATGRALKSPQALMDKSFADIGQRTGLDGMVGKTTQAMFDGAAVVAETTGRITGFNRRQYTGHIGKAHAAMVDLRSAPSLHNVPVELKTHLQAIHGAATSAAGIEHVDVSRVGDALTAIAAHVKAHPDAISSAAGKDVQKYIKTAEELVEHHGGAVGWKDVGAVIRNTPKTLSQAKLGPAIFNGGWLAASTLGTVGVARGFFQNLASLKQMYADMTGQDVSKVSTVGVLLGHVPKPVADARSYLMKNSSMEGLMQTASLAISIRQVISGKIGWGAMALQMGGGTVLSALMSESILPVYQSLSTAYKSGERIPSDVYAALIGSASSDLRERGGANSKFAQAIAEQYAQENLSPAQVLSEIDNGKLMVRVNKLMESKAPAAHTNAASQVSHVDRVMGKSPQTQVRPVVGDNTAKLNQNEALQAQHASPSLT